MKLSLTFSFAIRLLAQSAIGVPQAGMMVDHAGSLRAVRGIAQSFITGDPVRTGVLSASCSASFCVVKTDTVLFATQNAGDPGTPVPAGNALISIHGQTALLYFPAVNRFARFQNSQLKFLRWSIDGQVLSIRESSSGVQLAVNRGGEVWITALDGSVQSTLPTGTMSVLLLDQGVLYSLPGSAVLRRQDGTETSFELPGPVSLSQLGQSYVQVSTAHASYALRIDPGQEQLSLLPDPADTAANGVSQ